MSPVEGRQMMRFLTTVVLVILGVHMTAFAHGYEGGYYVAYSLIGAVLIIAGFAINRSKT
jgi:hypothetical protein